MAQGVDALTVQREVRVEARPETVFEFFTNADKMTRWMGQTAELEARPGGGFHVDINGRWIASGEFLEVVAPSRVVFTWGWEEGSAVTPGSSTVEVTLEPDGEATLVRLTHRDLPDEGARQAHDHGWANYLGRLVVAAPGGDPGPDRIAEQAM